MLQNVMNFHLIIKLYLLFSGLVWAHSHEIDRSCECNAQILIGSKKEVTKLNVDIRNMDIDLLWNNPESKRQFLEYINQRYPEELVSRVKRVAQRINGHHKERIFIQVFFQAEITKLKRIQNGLSFAKSTNWSEKVGYYTYPHHLGNQPYEQNGNLKSLEHNIPYLKNLGVDYIYLLPFYDSPRRDGGYDIKNYLQIFKEYGTLEDFNSLVKTLKDNDMDIIIDYIPGHVSEEHEWFKKAIQGHPKYKNYFFWSKVRPEQEVRIDTQTGDWTIFYKDENGKEYKRLLLFPDILKAHWIRRQNGEYSYGTFNDFQIDLNNQNPDVLMEHLENLGQWISLGG